MPVRKGSLVRILESCTAVSIRGRVLKVLHAGLHPRRWVVAERDPGISAEPYSWVLEEGDMETIELPERAKELLWNLVQRRKEPT